MRGGKSMAPPCKIDDDLYHEFETELNISVIVGIGNSDDLWNSCGFLIAPFGSRAYYLVMSLIE
jgi:hypothetical protein